QKNRQNIKSNFFKRNGTVDCLLNIGKNRLTSLSVLKIPFFQNGIGPVNEKGRPNQYNNTIGNANIIIFGKIFAQLACGALYGPQTAYRLYYKVCHGIQRKALRNGLCNIRILKQPPFHQAVE